MNHAKKPSSNRIRIDDNWEEAIGKALKVDPSKMPAQKKKRTPQRANNTKTSGGKPKSSH